MLAATGTHGLTGLAGSNSDPSVVGFCLSGGLSWFGRKHGVAAHSVLSVEIVDPQGELRVVTAESDPDLFWAIRGAGGDFGVVTAIEVQLYPADQLYGGRIMWPIEMARPVLRAFRTITENAPDELSMWTHCCASRRCRSCPSRSVARTSSRSSSPTSVRPRRPRR